MLCERYMCSCSRIKFQEDICYEGSELSSCFFFLPTPTHLEIIKSSILITHNQSLDCKRKWHPTPVLLPGKSHGWRSLVGCRLWGRTESDTTEAIQQQQHLRRENVQLFVTLWTVPTRVLCPWNFPGMNTGLGCHFLLQGIFLTQRLNLGLLHCSQILYR